MHLKTHYLRMPARGRQRLSTPSESAVYQAAPEDRLVVRDELLQLTEAYYKKNPEDGSFVPALAGAAIEFLVEKKMLVELHGSRLARWIEGM